MHLKVEDLHEVRGDYVEFLVQHANWLLEQEAKHRRAKRSGLAEMIRHKWREAFKEVENLAGPHPERIATHDNDINCVTVGVSNEQ